MEAENTVLGFEQFVDAKAAAQYLGMHWKTVQRLAREHVVPAYPFNGRRRVQWRFRISELDTWAKSRLTSIGHSCRNAGKEKR